MRHGLRGMLSRASDLASLVFAGNAGKAWGALSYRVHSDSISVGLRRDLSVRFTSPSASLPLTVRPLAATDDLSSLHPEPGITSDEAFFRLTQRRLLRSGLHTCYVAIAPDGKLCYMQWVIPASENERLRGFFGNLYPLIGRDEALLEGAYTPTAFRGKGIMGAAMAQVAERAAEFGARWVITFVDQQNAASIKGCLRAGFTPYLRRHEKFRLFYRQVKFDPLMPPAAVQLPSEKT
ncbi:MAG: GNAT family N-acetyltransferase [Gemmatimonadales bacterium]|nr:GNAT family N-acetyltransferase [Gemmatimonadales bacterium]